jgi:hypothetical protein
MRLLYSLCLLILFLKFFCELKPWDYPLIRSVREKKRTTIVLNLRPRSRNDIYPFSSEKNCTLFLPYLVSWLFELFSGIRKRKNNTKSGESTQTKTDRVSFNETFLTERTERLE